MTTEKLFKQFAELVTRFKIDFKIDEFFVARVRLTFFYFLTAVVILAGASIVLYNTILSNLAQSISEKIADPVLAQAVVDRAQDILLNRFLTIDISLTFLIVILGFLLTQKTLQSIKLNMQRQKRFIADASHELRTPIAVVISGLEVALRNKDFNLQVAKKTIENTLNEMKDFAQLSNALLDLSQYDTKVQMKFDSISISDLIESITGEIKNLASFYEINFEIKTKEKAMILGNKIGLSRVFYNVLDNAIKYTPRGGKVLISDKIVSNRYILTIEDSGRGIPKEIIDKIFEPFFRGDLSRNTTGAGLGLTLSRKIIEKHKGSISIKSEVNKGTSVIISLPISS